MMSLTRNDKLNLFLQKKSKKIKNKELAESLDVSESAISRYFNFTLQLSECKEQQLIEYIESKPQYQYIKVRVK
ncbi:HTH domain-containing protein [Oceanobacillus caeni]|uniref:HTH domain-containing protein n=1 Tax=Virgibacillus sp. SK37 TaxID=403957 RepID=UPI0011A258D4|nr:HTH domain-containing protein [Virgibacillus sp. SK37]